MEREIELPSINSPSARLDLNSSSDTAPKESPTAANTDEVESDEDQDRSLDPTENGFVEVKLRGDDDPYESGSDSEDGRIQGVYFQGEDGDMIEFGNSDDEN